LPIRKLQRHLATRIVTPSTINQITRNYIAAISTEMLTAVIKT